MSNLYVFCPRGSTGAFALAKELGSTRLRRFDGMSFWTKGGQKVKIEEGDGIVCWGTPLRPIEGVRILNAQEHAMDKLQENKRLLGKGIKTVSVQRESRYSTAAQLREAGYLPRGVHHTGGTDLLGIDKRSDFWVKKETIVNEYRIHSFGKKSIRAGRKVAREGFTLVAEADWKPESNMLHPWIRSWDGGWKMSYLSFRSTAPMRKIAHAATAALGLHFGAVDIGEREDGSLLVLEVNTAPGIEGGTLTAYAAAVNSWFQSRETDEATRDE